jgi:polyketide biosynthesis enoyl-CoA hydratase PksH
MVNECLEVLNVYKDVMQILVLEGLPDYFCFGADFQGIGNGNNTQLENEQLPEALYELLFQLAAGPFVSIALVRGKVNAGGVGLVAACDIVLADETAEFSLSELLFDLYPACVLPFLIRRIGFSKANYMSLMTRAISIQQALSWGLVDASEVNAESLLRKHLLRLRYLSKAGIHAYKNYLNSLDESLVKSRQLAISANRKLFSDTENIEKINRYVKSGRFPWES